MCKRECEYTTEHGFCSQTGKPCPESNQFCKAEVISESLNKAHRAFCTCFDKGTCLACMTIEHVWNSLKKANWEEGGRWSMSDETNPVYILCASSYISAAALKPLYGLHGARCVYAYSAQDLRYKMIGRQPEDVLILAPRYDGDYKEHLEARLIEWRRQRKIREEGGS